MRSYELMFVVDPRTSEEDAKSLATDVKNLVEATGAQVVKREHMGRRKLAYEIQKLKEGRYFLLYILTEESEGHGFATVEARMEQHDQILRYLVIRTDEDLQRAGLPLPEAGDDEEVDTEPEAEDESPSVDDDEEDDDEDDDDEDED